jgi:hypothetical protein
MAFLVILGFLFVTLTVFAYLAYTISNDRGHRDRSPPEQQRRDSLARKRGV